MGLGQSPSTQTCLISVFCSVVVSGWVASKERDKPHRGKEQKLIMVALRASAFTEARGIIDR